MPPVARKFGHSGGPVPDVTRPACADASGMFHSSVRQGRFAFPVRYHNAEPLGCSTNPFPTAIGSGVAACVCARARVFGRRRLRKSVCSQWSILLVPNAIFASMLLISSRVVDVKWVQQARAKGLSASRSNDGFVHSRVSRTVWAARRSISPGTQCASSKTRAESLDGLQTPDGRISFCRKIGHLPKEPGI